jgi:type VI secretion system protein VasG
VLPRISEEILKRMMESTPAERVRVRVAAGEFAYGFE